MLQCVSGTHLRKPYGVNQNNTDSLFHRRRNAQCVFEVREQSYVWRATRALRCVFEIRDHTCMDQMCTQSLFEKIESDDYAIPLRENRRSASRRETGKTTRPLHNPAVLIQPLELLIGTS